MTEKAVQANFASSSKSKQRLRPLRPAPSTTSRPPPNSGGSGEHFAQLA